MVLVDMLGKGGITITPYACLTPPCQGDFSPQQIFIDLLHWRSTHGDGKDKTNKQIILVIARCLLGGLSDILFIFAFFFFFLQPYAVMHETLFSCVSVCSSLLNAPRPAPKPSPYPLKKLTAHASMASSPRLHHTAPSADNPPLSCTCKSSDRPGPPVPGSGSCWC